VFDSGIGGISVLRDLVRELPHERFRYFGDSANAPYGGKPVEEILRLTCDIAERMLAEDAKAIVIACNTATSVAAQTLRERYPDEVIVGVEPALRPAVIADHHERILVMATDVTIELDKFHRLAEELSSQSEIIAVPCPGLADLIERGVVDGPEMEALLGDLVGEYRGQVDGVVLGCTHYPFASEAIARALGDAPLYDSGAGTARQLRRRLDAEGLLAPDSQEGTVEFASSAPDPAVTQLYRDFFEM
jgi:glutamate racemase